MQKKPSTAKEVIDIFRNTPITQILIFKKQLLRDLREQNLLTSHDLEAEIERSVILDAKESIEHMRKTNCYADHSGEPEYIAYAISQGKLSPSEISILKGHLDHESDIEIFCKDYNPKNLIPRLKERILNPKSITEYLGNHYIDPHPACC